MQKMSLTAQVRELLKDATGQTSGRSAKTVYGGHEHALSQTLIALLGGQSLHDHDNVGEATIQVLHGRVRLSTAELSWEAMTGDLIIVPGGRHNVLALEDAAMLFTTAKRSREPVASNGHTFADTHSPVVPGALDSAWPGDGWVSP